MFFRKSPIRSFPKNVICSHVKDVPITEAEKNLEEQKQSNTDPKTHFYIAGHEDSTKASIHCYTKR